MTNLSNIVMIEILSSNPLLIFNFLCLGFQTVDMKAKLQKVKKLISKSIIHDDTGALLIWLSNYGWKHFEISFTETAFVKSRMLLSGFKNFWNTWKKNPQNFKGTEQGLAC
jgi:hypothetical protein